MDIRPAPPLPEISPAEMTAAVRAALDDADCEILDFTCQQLSGGFEVASHVYLLSGQALRHDEEAPWSLILKVICSTPAGQGEDGIRYWKREMLAYGTDLLDNLPPGLRAPRCYHTSEQAGEVHIWMEPLVDDTGSEWTIEQYAAAARSLGRFNGAYLSGWPLPEKPWVPRCWLEKYVEHAARTIQMMRTSPQLPAIQQLFPGGGVRQVLAIWEERRQLLELLNTFPQVFCHQDAFRENLFFANDQLYGVDWTYMGISPLGAELAPLILASMGISSPALAARAAELDQAVFQAYYAGLRETGWQGSEKDIRLAYAVTLLLRYIIGATVGELLPAMLRVQDSEAFVKGIKAGMGAEFEQEIAQRSVHIGKYYGAITQEGFKLLGVKHLAGMALRTGMRLIQGKI